MKHITTRKRMLTSVILSLTLVVVIGITVFAAARAYGGFGYGGVDAAGWLNVTWNTGKDSINAGTDTISATKAAVNAKYKIGVRCTAYKGGKLIKNSGSDTTVTSSDTKVSTSMFINADKVTSIHNITTASGVVKKSRSLETAN